MEYGPTGRDGRWPHAHAVATFLRHYRRSETPAIREVATHEAGHAAVAHTLGLPTTFITARPSNEGPGHHRFDRDQAARFSLELRVIAAFGGRAADELAGRFAPVRLDAKTDCMTALGHATKHTGGDPELVAAALVTGLAEARRIVKDRWPEVLKVAEELVHRDLSGVDLKGILGPLPKPSSTLDRPWGSAEVVDIDVEVIDAAVIALVAAVPYGLGFLPGDGGTSVVWLSRTGEPNLTPYGDLK